MDVSVRIQRLGKHMVEVLLNSLIEGEMALDRAQQIANFYLAKIKTAGDHKELSIHVQTMLTELPEMHMVVRSDKIHMMKLQQQGKGVA